MIDVAEDQAQQLQDSKQYRDLQRVFEDYPLIARIDMELMGGLPLVTVTDTDGLKLVARINVDKLAIDFSLTDAARFWPAPVVLGTMQGVAQMLLRYSVTKIEIYR